MPKIPFPPKHLPEKDYEPVDKMSVADLSKALFGEEAYSRLSQTAEQQNSPEPSTPSEGCFSLLLRILGDVDFTQSRIPEHILTRCRMEDDTKAIIQLLRDDCQSISPDTPAIDYKLSHLIITFKDSIARGNATAARMALNGLDLGIREIRRKVPLDRADPMDSFAAESARYLDHWSTLLRFAGSCDCIQAALDAARAAAKESERQREARMEQVSRRLEEDPEFMKEFQSFLDSDTPTARIEWTSIAWEVHTLLIESKMADFHLQTRRLQCMALESGLRAAKQRMDVLQFCLNSLPDFSDPALTDQYTAAMEKFDHIIAGFDITMEQPLRTADRLSGIPDHLGETVRRHYADTRKYMQSARSSCELLPHITDPELFKRHNEGLQKLLQDIKESDARMDHALDLMNKLSGIMDGLKASPGSALPIAGEVVSAYLADPYSQTHAV